MLTLIEPVPIITGPDDRDYLRRLASQGVPKPLLVKEATALGMDAKIVDRILAESLTGDQDTIIEDRFALGLE